MKRWIAILGPEQVILISNTHTQNTENYFKIKRGQERRKPWLTNEKMVSYTGSSTGSTHKQQSHTMKTQKIILRSRGDRMR